MRIKKAILFFMLIMMTQINCRIAPALAETPDDESAVKNVIGNYLKSISECNVEFAVSQISNNYSDSDGLTYEQFKFRLEKLLEEVTNISITNIKISEPDIKDNKAMLEFKYNFEVKRKTAESINSIHKRIVYLAKENGSWRIIKLERVKE